MSDGANITSVHSESNPKSQKKKTHATFHFVAGLTSGVASAVLLQPADLLKTRVQQSKATSLLPTLRAILSGPNPISSLWRGTTPSALRTGFGSALYFSTLSTLRQFVANNAAKTPRAENILVNHTQSQKSSSVLPKLNATANLITGATARVSAGFVLMPVTVIKVRYESDLYAYKSIVAAARNIYTTEGLRGFFSGLGATTVRDAPYAGLYVVMYEGSKNRLNSMMSSISTDGTANTATTSAAINAASGVLAASSATAITNPFDAIKTRLQLMPTKYSNMWSASRLMFKEEGLRSFFDGLGLRMGRKAISSALAWTVYEELIGRAERSFTSRDGDKVAGAAV